jgi:hypothetical protein
MRETATPSLRVLKLITTYGLLATFPLSLGTLPIAGLHSRVAASSE